MGCRTCQVACCDKNDLDPIVVFRNVKSFEVGEFPKARSYHYSATCNHCENPACVPGCPTEAMYINEEDGTIQHDDEKCIGCQYCVKTCPYGVPQYVESLEISQKCDACIELRAGGEPPACVASCSMRALEFGSIDELRAKYPEAVQEIALLPSADMTSPSLAIAPKPIALEDNYQQKIL